jgi:hypothetical protein
MITMNRTIGIKRWHPNELVQTRYSAFMAAVGFETRARFVAESKMPTSDLKFACAFDNNKEHAYFDNLDWYERNQYDVEEHGDDQFESWCKKTLTAAQSVERDTLRLGIDISSMSRFRIAALVATLSELDTVKPVDVDFFYAPSQFVAPLKEEGPIIICEPVLDKFAGWSLEPEQPTVAVFGLGYEYDKALGALEYIEPGSVWAFMPYGEDPRYEAGVTIANEAFRESVPPSQVFEYNVDQPLDCYRNLESLLHGKLKTSKPILIPFGPKIFALNCLLVACLYYPSVAVWRVSSGPFEPAVDRVSNGKIVGVRVEFTVRDQSGK